MNKHVYFFIGVFVTPLISIPILLGILGASEDLLRDLAVFSFGLLAALIVVLIIALLFRNYLLPKLKLSAEVGATEIAGQLGAVISTGIMGDIDASTAHASEMMKSGIAWYTWSNFYRWVIRTAIAITVVFIGSAGTMLLFEQNKKLGQQTEQLKTQNDNLALQTKQLEKQNLQFIQQNELLSLNLVSDLRTRLAANTKADIDIREFDGVLGKFRNKCSWKLVPQRGLQSVPNQSTINTLVNLAKSETLGKRVKDAMGYLIDDNKSTVALGALLVLDKLKLVPDETRLILKNFYAEEIVLENSNVIFEFINSVVAKIECKKCLFDAINYSVVQISENTSIRNITNSFVVAAESDTLAVFGDLTNSIVVSEKELGRKPIIPFEYFHLKDIDSRFELSYIGRKVTVEEGCQKLQKICKENRFLECLMKDTPSVNKTTVK